MVDYQSQHPIPQEVTSYQFRLVGDMTLKQFFQVAGGALVALFFYSTNLIGFIKWPLILISFIMGIAMAFIPFEDRPLEKWIVLFFKSIYSPTLFSWHKGPKFNYFQAETENAPVQQLPLVALPKSQTDQAEAPLGLHTEATEVLSDLEKSEENILADITHHMATAQVSEISHPPRSKMIDIPKEGPTGIEANINNDNQKVKVNESDINEATENVSAASHQAFSATKQATISSNATPPIPPHQPNIIVGQVLGLDGNIIAGAILEIRDEEGRPARAFRSNQLGHFGIVTPLLEGKYEILTEKEGYTFDPVIVNVTGEIMEPIEIRAKEALMTQA